MRLIFLLLGVATVASARAESIACRNVRFLANVQQVGGAENPIYIPVYQSSDYTIHVEPAAKGTYGFVAHTQTSLATPAVDNFDVKVSDLAPDTQEELPSMVRIMIPTLDYARVSNIRYANIGVDANANQDSSGSAIYELLGDDGTILGRIAKIGWGYGLCAADLN